MTISRLQSKNLRWRCKDHIWLYPRKANTGSDRSHLILELSEIFDSESGSHSMQGRRSQEMEMDMDME